MTEGVKVKTYSKREFEQLLNDNGYEFARCRGSHFVYKKGSVTIVIPKNLNSMISRRLIKEHNLITM